MVTAAVRYPGGTWCDPRAAGYRVLESFFCDVLHERGLNGAPNPGAPWARAALSAIALAFVPFWWALPWTMKLTRYRGALVRSLGLVSASMALGVGLTPSDRLPWLHQVAVLTASAAGVAAALLATTGPAVRGAPRGLRVLAWSALTTAALDAALYLLQVLRPEPCAAALPALQKLSALLVLGWMLATAVILVRTPSALSEGARS